MTMITTRIFLLIIILGLILPYHLVQAAKQKTTTQKQQPHILLIVADDLGYNDVGYHQNQKSSANPQGVPTTNAAAGIMRTPAIDELAAGGVKLENYYVQPLCSPTRSTLMTGRYASHTGMGPNVDRIDYPYGVPAKEVFFPQQLQALNYKCHMVGKWHLGACDKRYHPTYRGFDSYVGYLAGGQGYYNQAGDRNSTCANELGPCLGESFEYNYSSIFFANQCIERIKQHDGNTNPLFLYLAFQSVHDPYDVPPIDVNKTFPEIVDYKRRIYAGMIQMMDQAVRDVVNALRQAKMWDDTVLIFTSDNGGIDVGSNYPLRGTKVFNWEGGIKAVGFVRGTNNPNLAPLPSNTTCNALMHSTDWFPTLVQGLAGGDDDTKPKPLHPLDGYNQWPVLQGKQVANKRTSIFHQVPVGAKPIKIPDPRNSSKSVYTSSMCLRTQIDNRTDIDIAASSSFLLDPNDHLYYCSAFGLTGGALRVGDYKLLITHPHDQPAPWMDTSSPDNAHVYTPGGQYPNGTPVFVPTTPPDIPPKPYKSQYYLFNIAKDPSESHNLAQSMPDKLNELLQIYQDYAMSATTVPSLDWRWGFTDPTWTTNPAISDSMAAGSGTTSGTAVTTDRALQQQDTTAATGDGGTFTCMGPFLQSQYCAYGHEWECYIMHNTLEGYDIGEGPVQAESTIDCQAKCAAWMECRFWVFIERKRQCQLKSARGTITPCDECVFGPKECPS